MQFELAARSLEMTPIELAARIALLVDNLDDVWPVIDESYLATLKQMHGGKYFRPPTTSFAKKKAGVAGLLLSKDACNLIELMVRRKQWGGNRITEVALMHVSHCTNFDLALRSVIKCGFVVRGKGHTLSLNPSERTEIERALEASSSDG